MDNASRILTETALGVGKIAPKTLRWKIENITKKKHNEENEVIVKTKRNKINDRLHQNNRDEKRNFLTTKYRSSYR